MANPRIRSACLVIPATAAMLMAGFTSGCLSPEAPIFNPRDMQRIEKIHSGENPEQPVYPLHQAPQPVVLPTAVDARRQTVQSYRTPTTLPRSTTQPAVRLTLQQCIHLAAANSLTVRVASYQPGIDESRVREAQAKWDPIFFTQVQFQHTDVIQPSVQDPTITNPIGEPIRFSVLSFESGIKEDTPYGTEFQIVYDYGYTDRLLPAILQQPGQVNPFYNNELTLKITQPLLQNFGADANYARITIARNTQGVSLLDFRLALEKQMADIEEAYWQLVLAERDVQIREELLQRAKATDTLVRARVGTDATDIDVAQSEAAVSQREEDLPTARAAVEKLSNKLKRLINDPTLPVATGPLLLPADIPTEDPIQFDPKEAINTALDYRAELAQQRLKIDSAYVTQKAARNNELPTLNFTGSFGVQGDGSTFGGAFRSQGDANLLDYTAGFELDIPLGFQEAKAIYRRTLLTRLQAISQYADTQSQVTQEVKDTLADVTATWSEIDKSRQARLKVQHELGLLEDRIQNHGLALSPPITQNRLQFQSDLAEAERREMDAITRYNIALSKLEQAKGTLLRYNNVNMAEEAPSAASPVEREYGR